jgi:Tol biopolymer transport system component
MLQNLDWRIDEESQVRDQLARVLASSAFTRSGRMQQFLRFIVVKVLEGQHDVLKESYIGTTVFDREPSYDPKVDPIVRVEARRLRSKLESYYQNEGHADPVIIRVPKGGYLPVFEAAVPPATSGEGSNQAAYLDTAIEPASAPASATPARPQQAFWKRYALTFVFGAATLFLAIILAVIGARWMFHRPHQTRIVPITSFLGQELDPAASPDRKHLAFSWNGNNNNYDIYIKNLETGEVKRLTNSPAQDLRPAWSPDGRDIAFLQMSPEHSRVMIIPALGGPERAVGEIHNAVNVWKADASQVYRSLGPAWSEDGRALFVTDQLGAPNTNGLYLWPLGYGERRQLTRAPEGSNDFYPALSPDGHMLGFVRQTSNSAADVFVLALRTGTLRQLTSAKRGVLGLTWDLDGRSIIYSTNRSGVYNLWRMPLERDVPVQLTTNSTEATDPSISRNGTLNFVDTIQNTNIWRLDLSAGNATQHATAPLISSSRKNNSPQYSPDGKRIAFVSDRSGSWELWISNSDGTDSRQITFFRGPMLGTPHWAPDGKWIAFDARPQGHSAIYLISPDHGTQKLLESNAFEERMPSWSHDGQWLYFNSDRGGKIQLWKMHLADGTTCPLTQRTAYDNFESPDGRFVYFLSNGPGVWRVSTDGANEAPVPELHSIEPSRYLALVGENLYFVANESTPSQIERYDLKTRRITTVGLIEHDLVDGTPSLSVSPDEHWLLYAQKDSSNSDIMSLQPE